jgi:CRP/FNR family cyclic AMP-dependent transcriptional regulator
MVAMVQTLSELPLFAQLGAEALEMVAPGIEERNCSPGQVIVWEGEPCEAIWLVAKGLVRASRLSQGGRQQMLAYLGPGESLNLVAALDGGPSLVTAVAVTDTILCAVRRDHFWSITRRHGSMAQAVLKGLAAEVRRLSDTVEDLALPTARVRLAQFLLDQAEDDTTRQHWTQGEVALRIGMGRDMVRRTLWALDSDGLIRRERGRIVVVDHRGLQREAQQSPMGHHSNGPPDADTIQPALAEAFRGAASLTPQGS